MPAVSGIHHITVVSRDPQVTVDFYRTVLGLRLVKKTVNFDDPRTYHFYFGDEIGSPGTILTFFPWTALSSGRHGNGEVSTVSFSVPQGSFSYWRDRFQRMNITVREDVTRFDDSILSFDDPYGLPLELVESDESKFSSSWISGHIPQDAAIHGFHGATLQVSKAESTMRILTGDLGYHIVDRENKRVRLSSFSSGPASLIDIEVSDDKKDARIGSGSVHHIAFRVTDEKMQGDIRRSLLKSGIMVTPMQDRKYFKSMYFRDFSGILFELATDSPGFVIDEKSGQLGESLMLPAWLESQRGSIETMLPPLKVLSRDEELSHVS